MSKEERNWIKSLKKLLACIVECRICARSKNRERITPINNDVSALCLEITDLVARGGFGKVFRCRQLDTDRDVAMKQLQIENENQGVPAFIIREVSLLKELRHDNIVSLLQVGHSQNDYINLVFEHLHCDLRSYIQNRDNTIDAMTRRSFMFQIVSAVAYCHSSKILHRDLKPSNVLVDHSRKLIKVADFGLAREFGHPDVYYTPNVGSFWYRAPEIMCNFPEYSTPVDLWSVGCIFAEMVIRQPLFKSLHCKDEMEAIFRLLGTPTEQTWPGITRVMPYLRLTYPKFLPLGLEAVITDLEPHGVHLLSMMLRLNPSERISAEAALEHAYFTDMDLKFNNSWISSFSKIGVHGYIVGFLVEQY